MGIIYTPPFFRNTKTKEEKKLPLTFNLTKLANRILSERCSRERAHFFSIRIHSFHLCTNLFLTFFLFLLAYLNITDAQLTFLNLDQTSVTLILITTLGNCQFLH